MKRSNADGRQNVSRRSFLFTTGLAAAGAPFLFTGCAGTPRAVNQPGVLPQDWKDERKRAHVRAVFVYPPSKQMADDPNGWWSWPGNAFDAEGHQKRYTAELKKIEQAHGMTIAVDDQPVANTRDAQRIANELSASNPDGLLIVLFHNPSLSHVDLLLAAAEKQGIPAMFYINLGVKHGAVTQYRRPGVHFVQSMDNFQAIDDGMRMFNTRCLLNHSRLLSITNVKEVSQATEPFLGIQVRTIPTAEYAARFRQARLDDESHQMIRSWTRQAGQVHVAREALENAARAHRSMQQMIHEHQAHGVTMNCLREGMLKPCMSFAMLNGQLFPAACENDKNAAYGLFLGEALTGRAGFMHNPAYETVHNRYFGSHCTCATKLHGPDGIDAAHVLRKFLHSNEGSCAIQTFWPPDEPVTMIHYYSGQPATLDVYAGKVYESHDMDHPAGCTTNVEIQITDRPDACDVQGHHNILFCGDFAHRFRQFANLFKMKLA